MPRYTLPDLGYDFSALEPHISGELMERHYDTHHAGHVRGANEALARLVEHGGGEVLHHPALARELAFHASGHFLHTLFWRNLAPCGGGRPRGELAHALDRDFGGFASFRHQLTDAACSVMGTGWAALVWEPLSRRLMTAPIHDDPSNPSSSSVPFGSVPLMVLDAWEHAFYLQYQHRKIAFFEAVWHVWNWEDIEQRFEAVQEAGLQLTMTPSPASRGVLEKRSPGLGVVPLGGVVPAPAY